MNLYLDASALVKRYVAEPNSELVRDAMERANGWFVCRVGYVETARAIGLVGGAAAVRALRAEWPAFSVVELSQDLADSATDLALEHELRSLDALHLAAALILPREGLVVATWDKRLHTAAGSSGLKLLPPRLG
ncbi:MAG: type II toxin-antitoxin system VapC family toxin [Solirubrobacterales bacterium]